MQLTEKQIDNLFLCGLLGYACDRCISVLDIAAHQQIGFRIMFYQEGSDINKTYRRGADKFDLISGKKLYEAFVNDGDMKAYDELKKLRAAQQDEYARQKRIFNKSQGKN